MVKIMIEDYCNYIEYEKGYSTHTVDSYLKNIDDFMAFLNTKKLKIQEVKYPNLREYLALLYDKGYKKRTICNHISALRSYFKYLLKEKIIDTNPTVLLSNPKLDKNQTI